MHPVLMIALSILALSLAALSVQALLMLRRARSTMEHLDSTLLRLSPTLDRLDGVLEEAHARLLEVKGMTRAAAGAGSLAERIRSAASLVPLEPLSVMASVATAVFRGVQAFSNYRKGAGPSPGNGHGAG